MFKKLCIQSFTNITNVSNDKILDTGSLIYLSFNDNLGEMHKITSSKNKSKVIFQGKGA
jgi:hypothetical protein